MKRIEQSVYNVPAKINAQPYKIFNREDLLKNTNALIERVEKCAVVSIDPVYLKRLRRAAFSILSKHSNKDIQSFVYSMLEACSCGLVPDGNEATIIPYGQTFKFLIMKNGLIKLIHYFYKVKNEAVSIRTGVIREGHDDVIASEKTGVLLYKKKNLSFSEVERTPIAGSFASVYHVKDSWYDFKILNRAQINARHAKSSSKGGDAWTKFFDEMAEKCALHRLGEFLDVGDTQFKSIVEKNDVIPFENGVLNLETEKYNMDLCDTPEDLYQTLITAQHKVTDQNSELSEELTTYYEQKIDTLNK